MPPMRLKRAEIKIVEEVRSTMYFALSMYLEAIHSKCLT